MNIAILKGFSFIAIAVFFVLFAWGSQTYAEELKYYMNGHHVWGALVYLGVIATSIVVVPVSSLPLIPLATAIWGVGWAAVLHTAGSLLGSAIAFIIARHYGKPLVRKLVSLEQVGKIAKFVPEHHVFGWAVALRLLMPIDIFSYVLGLFTHLRLGYFILATLIGVIPFSIMYSLLGTVPWWFQIIGIAAIGIVLAWGTWLLAKYQKNKKNDKKLLFESAKGT